MANTPIQTGENIAPTPTPVVQENGVPMMNSGPVAGTVKCVVVPNEKPVAKECGYDIVITPPAPKATLAYLVGPGAKVDLTAVDMKNAVVTQEGQNLRISTADGGEILLLDYVTSAKSEDCTSVVTTQGEMAATKLLIATAPHKIAKLADIEPAAGPETNVRPVAAPVQHDGFTAPNIDGNGFGFGDKVLSSVIGPFAIPFGRDEIDEDDILPIAPAGASLVPPPPVLNTPPDAKNDTATVSCGVVCGHSVTINVLANDTDPNGDPLTITGISGLNPALGTATIVGNQIVFTPASGVTGAVTFNYSISDGHGGADTATVTVNVTNTPPDAVNDSANTAYQTAVTIDVLANDTDAECKPGVTITGISGLNPALGTASIVAGKIVFTPAAGVTGDVTFNYSIADGCGASDTACVTVHIGTPPPPVNDDPHACDDVATVSCGVVCGHSVTINVLANDTDPNGDPLTITGISGLNPALGTATIVGNQIVFTPASGVTGAVTFNYSISDGHGGADTATVIVNVTNTPPDAVNDSANTAYQTAVTIDVLANDTDAECKPGVTITGISGLNPALGTASIVAGKIVFTPAAGVTGDVTFNYSIADGCGASDTACVTVHIGTPPPPVNDDPHACDDVATVSCGVVCGHSVTINVLANDTDPNGDPLTITGISGLNPALGTATIVGNQIVFTPASGVTGNVTFQYAISDGHGGTDTANVTVTITNTPPDAVNDSGTTKCGCAVTTNVLANDTDAECKPGVHVVSASINPAQGTVVVNPDNTITYTPAVGFVGTATYTYTISDGCGATDTATVTITVTNTPPDAVDDTATVSCGVVCGHSVTINVLANDTDLDGDAITLVSINGLNPAQGTASIVGNQVVFTPASGVTGIVTFTYTIRDACGATDTATVTVNITNTPPDAVDDTATVSCGVVCGHSVTTNVLANDTDAECKPGVHVVSASINPAYGTVVVNANDTITFTPASGVVGVVTYTYTISDGCGGTDTATVTVNITNTPPDAVDDTATVSCGVVCGHSVTTNVLANDTDAECKPGLKVVSASINPSYGTVTVNADNTITFTPASGVVGVVTYTYTISDGCGGTDTATVTVNITNTPPDAVDDTANVGRLSSVTINVLANDTDAECKPGVHVVSYTNPAHGTVHLNSDGTFTYTHTDASFSGMDYFTYTIADGCGGYDTATVCVSVPHVPPPPPPPPVCPLVIDLDGDGIHTITLADSHAHFDLNNDGIAEHTAWFGPHDGILVHDTNGNGIIDNLSEMYGTNDPNSNGYNVMAAAEDTNHDGVVNADDAGFANIQVWVDANSDGVTDAGELHSLSEFGITSINVGYDSTHVDLNDDSFIGQTSTVTLADGSTLDSADVWFHPATDSVLAYNGTGDDVAALPVAVESAPVVADAMTPVSDDLHNQPVVVA